MSQSAVELPTSIPTAAEAPAGVRSLRSLLVVNTVLLAVIVALLLGFGGYYVVSTSPAAGGAKQVEVKVVDYDVPVRVALISGTISEDLALDNRGVAKTWNLTVPYGQMVTVTMLVADNAGGALAATCSISMGKAALTSQSLQGAASAATCTWTNR